MIEYLKYFVGFYIILWFIALSLTPDYDPKFVTKVMIVPFWRSLIITIILWCFTS